MKRITTGLSHSFSRGDAMTIGEERYRIVRVATYLAFDIVYEWEWYNREFERVFLILVGVTALIFIWIWI